MPIYEEIARLVGEIQDDRSHGAIELARRALVILRTAAEHSQADTVDQFLYEQRGIVQVLILVRPSMAPIRNVANLLMKALSDRAGELDVRSLRDFVTSKANEMVTYTRQAVARIARNTLDLVADGNTIMTHSYSSTVVAAMQEISYERKNIRVIVTRSGPGRTGEAIARQLGGFGIPVTLIDDAAAALHMPSVNSLMLGADTVCADGVVNGIGSYQLALVSATTRVPVYVLCDSLKFDPELTRESVDLEKGEPSEVCEPFGLPAGVAISNPRFDFTPLELVTGIVTEDGVVPPSDSTAYLKGMLDSLT
jgi:translation initiation factor eIF-2B subunit delta